MQSRSSYTIRIQLFIFIESRASKNARTNYDAICPKCKYEWNNAPEGFIPLKEEPIIEEEIVELEENE
jgi:hypothetical protein